MDFLKQNMKISANSRSFSSRFMVSFFFRFRTDCRVFLLNLPCFHRLELRGALQAETAEVTTHLADLYYYLHVSLVEIYRTRTDKTMNLGPSACIYKCLRDVNKARLLRSRRPFFLFSYYFPSETGHSRSRPDLKFSNYPRVGPFVAFAGGAEEEKLSRDKKQYGHNLCACQVATTSFLCDKLSESLVFVFIQSRGTRVESAPPRGELRCENAICEGD